MSSKLKLYAAGLALGASTALFGVFGNANAASSQESEYIHPACEGADAVCGVIVYAVAGSYTVDWVSVEARGTQPDAEATHPACPGTKKKFDRNTPSGNYDTFILPANCAYKLKIKILSANKKDKDLFLTPGCKIIAKTDGTAVSNSWKNLDVSALSAQVPTVNGTPVDAAGHKCGKQGSAGF